MTRRTVVIASLSVIALTVVSLVGVTQWGATTSRSSLQLSSCQPSSTRGSVVQVTLSDNGAMMMGDAPIGASIVAAPTSVHSGVVTFIATNDGLLNHELVVLPLPADGAGTRPVGSNGKVDESQSLGEASTSCGAGPGDGISPGARSWTTITLTPGRYELLCDVPWHYASGMFTEFTVS